MSVQKKGAAKPYRHSILELIDLMQVGVRGSLVGCWVVGSDNGITSTATVDPRVPAGRSARL